MQRMLIGSGLMLALTLGLPAKDRAQGRKRGEVQRTPGNAAAGTPHASADRDLARERALEAGKGNKTGLHKDKHANKAKSKKAAKGQK